MLVELMGKHRLQVGGGATYEELFVERNIIFGDFLKPGIDPEERKYEEVPDIARLSALLEEYMEEYNLTNTNHLNLGEMGRKH